MGGYSLVHKNRIKDLVRWWFRCTLYYEYERKAARGDNSVHSLVPKFLIDLQAIIFFEETLSLNTWRMYQ